MEVTRSVLEALRLGLWYALHSDRLSDEHAEHNEQAAIWLNELEETQPVLEDADKGESDES